MVRSSQADWYTRVRDTIDIEVLGPLEEAPLGTVHASFGDVRVTTQVIGFQRISTITQDPIDLVGLDLPGADPGDPGAVVGDPRRGPRRRRVTPAQVPGAAHAAEHAAIGLLPLVATCDRWDVGGVSTPLHPDIGSCAIFIYDGYPGGAGIAERGYRSGPRLLEATLTAVRECPAATGAPPASSRRNAATATSRWTRPAPSACSAAMLGHEQSRVA